MEQKRFKKYIFNSILVGVIFGAGWLVGKGSGPAPSTAPARDIIGSETAETASILFDFGNGSIRTYTNIPVFATTTLADVLTTLSKEKKIVLDAKDYGGALGLFIKSIDGIPAKQVRDSWWQFWVNNTYGTVGASTYVIHDGDVIAFKFIKGQQ